MIKKYLLIPVEEIDKIDLDNGKEFFKSKGIIVDAYKSIESEFLKILESSSDYITNNNTAIDDFKFKDLAKLLSTACQAIEQSKSPVWVKDLKNITKEDVLEIILIEGCHNSLEFWDKPIITDFDNNIFSDTVVLDYFSYRTADNLKSKPFKFFFNFNKLDFHYTIDYENDKTNGGMKRSSRVKIETVKYLISQRYNVLGLDETPPLKNKSLDEGNSDMVELLEFLYANPDLFGHDKLSIIELFNNRSK